NPPPYLIAKPLENNILEWYCITFFVDPQTHLIIMENITVRRCEDNGLVVLLSTLYKNLGSINIKQTSNEATTGSIKTTDSDKRIYAARSHQFNLNDPKFKEIFTELCTPEAVPVEILYPINKSSSSSSTPVAASTGDKQLVRPDPQAPQQNDHGAVNQQLAARNALLQRRPQNRVDNHVMRGITAGVIAAHAEHVNNNTYTSMRSPCSAAAFAVGIPSAIVSNFTFDAVYNGLCEGDDLDTTIKQLVEQVVEDYKKSELLIRLPGYIPMPSYTGTQLYPDSGVSTKPLKLLNACATTVGVNHLNGFDFSLMKHHRNVVDVPLVVRKSITPRDVFLSNLGILKEIYETHKALMVSFGGQNLVGIEEWGNPLPDGWIAIVCGDPGTTLPERFYVCPREAYIPDLTNAVDAVMGKLGYGTCSECIGHGKPFIYVPRPQFIEELGLKRLMEIQGSCVEMSKEHFETGQWKKYILQASRMSGVCEDVGKRLTHDGGKVAAKLLEKFLDARTVTIKKTRNATNLVFNSGAVAQLS
ncbi:1755_t:CDS:2, partial [Acaulospora colombiana]